MPVMFCSRSIRKKRANRATYNGWRLPLRAHDGDLMCWSYKQSAVPWSMELLW
jgi:hypothetical protein